MTGLGALTGASAARVALVEALSSGSENGYVFARGTLRRGQEGVQSRIASLLSRYTAKRSPLESVPGGTGEHSGETPSRLDLLGVELLGSGVVAEGPIDEQVVLSR